MLLEEGAECVEVFMSAFLVGDADKKGIGKGVGDYSICRTFASFSTQTARFFTYSVTSLTSSGVVAVHPGDCPVAGSMGFVIVPSRYPLSPRLATTTWSQTFQVVHSLLGASSFSSLISSDVLLAI